MAESTKDLGSNPGFKFTEDSLSTQDWNSSLGKSIVDGMPDLLSTINSAPDEETKNKIKLNFKRMGEAITKYIVNNMKITASGTVNQGNVSITVNIKFED